MQGQAFVLDQDRYVVLTYGEPMEATNRANNSHRGCVFWYVDALACVGTVTEAKKIPDQLLLFSNHLGIFSEDVGEDGSQWGNFPQTYSHVGLINAVCRNAKKFDSPEFL